MLVGGDMINHMTLLIFLLHIGVSNEQYLNTSWGSYLGLLLLHVVMVIKE